MRKYFTITELTREFGVSTRTLRFYEDEGLIQPDRRGRTRLFRSADRHLIKEILRGRRLGFTIKEIREIIEIYKGPPGELGQLELMMTRVAEKRAQLLKNARISRIRWLNSTMSTKHALRDWRNYGLAPELRFNRAIAAKASALRGGNNIHNPHQMLPAGEVPRA